MKITTLIPTRFNDGKKVSRSRMQFFIDEFARQFGGASEEGLTKGQWIDPSDATRYRDESVRVSVVCDRVFLEDVRQAVILIGIELQQRAMYFEVRDYDGVQMLEIPYSQG